MTIDQTPRKQAAARLRFGGVVALGALLFVVLAVWSATGVGDQAPSDEFWAALRITGDEVEGYPTLDSMAQASDTVIAGTFVDFGVSRQIQGDAEEDVVTYAMAEVAIDETVIGSGAGAAITLEFLLNVPPRKVDALVTELRGTLPTSSMVLFLREKRGPGEVGLYRLVNGDGLWITTDTGVETPLSARVRDPAYGGGFPAHYREELDGATTLDDLIAIVKG